MKKSYTVSIVIPNWNGETLLKKNLPKILETSGDREIIVSDDHSSDLSRELLLKEFPMVRVISNDQHKGFASTVNAGVQAATGDIIILLNTDIVPEKGYLDPLLFHFKDPKIFAVGCLDKSHEKGEIILRGRGIGWWHKGYFFHKRGEVDASDTAWVSGGSGAFRKSLWDELGGMDVRFDPFYWEDIDLSYRAKEKGYSVCFEPKSVVHHYHEEGKIKSEFTKEEIKSIAYRNQFYFIWKHASFFQFILHILWTPIYIAKEILRGDVSMGKGWLHALPNFFPLVFLRS